MRRLTLIIIVFLTTIYVMAYDVEVSGIYYNLNRNARTAEVTFKGEKYGDTQSYSGKIIIPESITVDGTLYHITSIASYAFYKCLGLTSIDIPNSVNSIGESAFEGCSNLPIYENIRYADTYLVEVINKSCTSAIIKDGTKWIGSEAFYECTNLTSLQLPNTITSIGELAFEECNRLTSINIPNAVSYIGEEAFAHCTSLTSIEIPNSITRIPSFAFIGCKALSSIIIPSSVKSIDSYAFYNCIGLKSLAIPISLTTIGNWAFYGCLNLTSIEIPKYVTSIGRVAFSGCSSLTSITVDKENTVYDSRDYCNAIIETSSNKLLFGCMNTIIPCSITSIEEGAFHSCKDLTSIIIPNSVISIGDAAFCGCEKIKEFYCYAENVPKMGSNVFASSPIAQATLKVPYQSVSKYRAAEQWSEFGNIEGVPTKAESITFSKSNVNITINESFQLIVTVLPEDIPNKSVTWSSNNTTIASVDQNGLVTANNVGEATITATTTDGSNISASCKVTVTPILATSITIDKKTAEIYIGDNTTLTATVLPEDATSKSVAWTSSDENIATVANGVVQGVSAGTVTITASTTDGSNLSATCLVTVKSRVATSISLNPSSEDIVVGNSCQLSATVLPEDIPNKGVTWSSNNTSIVSVDQNGFVTANNVGEATITATTTDGSNLSASCKVTVTPILATSITLDKITAEINVGGSTSLSATILPETATYKSVTWRSSNESVATVTDGIVIGNAPGTAIISASTIDGSNLTVTCTVTVLDVLATMISLDKEALDLYVDEATTLTVAVYPDNTTNKAVTWTSSNASVATVADGVVTAKSEGTATITAKTTDGSNLSATCLITVRRHPQTITWNQDLSTVVSGGELIKLEAAASSGLDITFSSSDEDIASIFMFSDGAYLNAYGEGNVNITASQPGNNYYVPASIVKTVNVVASSSIKDVTSEGLFTIYTLNGIKVGTFTAEEYQRLKLVKGVYIVNGKKTAIK